MAGQLQQPCWAAALSCPCVRSDGRPLATPRMPESENLDLPLRLVDPIVEVVAGAAQEEAPHTLEPRGYGASSDAWLKGEEFERSLQVFSEGKGCFRAILAPPGRRSPDLGGGGRSGFDRKSPGQGLLAELAEQRLRIHELAPGCLLQRLLQDRLFFRGEFERLVRLRNEYCHRGAFLERLAVDFEATGDDLAGGDAHRTRLAQRS